MRRARDLVGTVLDGRYELRSVLGEGAFGRVYLGRDRRLARIVAIKVIKPAWGDDPEWVDSFLQEARLLARVSDPGIVQIFDVGHAPEGPYYVAEFVDGESLASRLSRGPLPPREACDVAEQLCRALAHAHDQRIVHRDIKPANVLISARGQVKVGDFGVARLTENTTEAPAAMILGTPRYMAPEQARGRGATPAADVYSAGIVLYEMLAGSPPFAGGSAIELAMRHANDAPPPLAPDTPASLTKVLARALAKDPAARYPDGRSMARALARARPRATEEERGSAASRAREDEFTEVVRPTRTSGERAAEPALAGAGAATALVTAPASLTDAPDSRSAAPGSPAGVAASPAAAPASLEAPAGTTRVIPSSPTTQQRRRSRGADAAGARVRARRSTDHLDATRVAPHETLVRKAGPSPRRRRLAALAITAGAAAAVVAGLVMLVGALTAPSQVRVPKLRGAGTAALAASARHAGLLARFSHHYSAKPVGVAIAQHPAPGTLADSGSVVNVVLSKGPLPVEVPGLIGYSSSSASSLLSTLHLNATLHPVPAPGKAPGTVTGQSPVSGVYVAPHRAVSLLVAEVPQWQPTLTSFGPNANSSVPFRIQGTKWRIVYNMNYQGTCTFIFFCEGPSATVVDLSNHSTTSQFDLNGGSDQTQVIDSGPGIYQIRISSGLDTASWSVGVQDYY